MSRFTDVMGMAPVEGISEYPSPLQIAAVGAALPDRAVRLSDEQQRAWFGGVVFDAPVMWDEKAGEFVSGDARFTPMRVGKIAREGH